MNNNGKWGKFYPITEEEYLNHGLRGEWPSALFIKTQLELNEIDLNQFKNRIMKTKKTRAEQEFDILEKTVKDAVILPFKSEILALVEAFGNNGDSGGSAPFTAGAISQAVKSLCLQNPICDITGKDEEWADVSGDMGKEIYQNMRCSGLFKDENGIKYNDAIYFRGQSGSTFGSGSVSLKNGKTIGSIQKIKGFPFRPKTFYVDVIETEWADKEETVKEEGGGWWTHIVKDDTQLKEARDYYDMQ